MRLLPIVPLVGGLLVGAPTLVLFLPLQLTYAEFVFEAKNFPDFTEREFAAALEVFARRTRKFGQTPQQVLAADGHKGNAAGGTGILGKDPDC